MKNIKKWISLLLTLALAFAWLPATARAATDVSGTVNVSSLPENAELKLTGNTTLIVNVDKTLKSISGDYALTIKGSGSITNSLTIDSGGHGISVSSIDISSCILAINSKRDGLNIDGDVVMNGGLLAIDAGKDGIFSRNGSISLKGVVDAGSGNNCSAISAEKGNITADGNITASGAKYAIWAPEGAVELNGTVTARAAGWAIQSGKGIRINGGKTVARAGVGMITGGLITINADVEATATMENAPAMAATLGIHISGGTVTAECSTNGDAMRTSAGSITVESGTVTASGAEYAIYAPEGSVSLNGTVTAKAAGWAIRSKNGIRINGGKTIARAGVGMITTGAITITDADVEAKATMTNAPAMAATEGIRISGGTVLADCSTNGDAIRTSAGNIVIKDATVTANGAEYAIYAPEGSVDLDGTVTAKAAGWAIRSKNGIRITGGKTVARAGVGILTTGALTISADVEAKATMQNAPAMAATEGVTIDSGIVWATSSSYGDAIRSSSGNITVNGGIVTASGAEYGICAHDGRVTLKGKVIATGTYAVWGGSGITVPSPYSILVPTGGTISGKEIVTQDGKGAVCVQVTIPPLSGSIRSSNITPAPGSQLSYSLSGMVAEIDRSKLRYQWQSSENGESGWTDMDGATSMYYVVQMSDVGKYLRVRITADGYEGMLYSAPRLCVKWPCSTGVVSPILEISSNQVRVMNPQRVQEYIILSSKKATGDLTEGDWANSQTWDPNDTVFYLGGTANTVNYVYTRVKETGGTYAGKTVGWQSIYLGETTAVQDIAIQPRLMVYSDDTWISRIMETDEHSYYYAKLGDVIQITATPTPANATFSGIQGSKWLVKGYSVSSQYGRYYTTPECTTLISGDQYYKTVYFRPENTMINGMELRAEYTRGYNDVASDAFIVNVGNKLGAYNLTYAQFPSVTIEAGDLIEGISAELHPDKASIAESAAALTGGTGTAPIITFGENTFTVDAANATGGDYYYKVSRSGVEVGGITVHVTTPPVEELRIVPAELTAEPGFSSALALQFFPADSETQAVWESSDPAVATVTDGVVTIADTAPVAGTATITATAGGKTAACEVTVTGEVFDLTVDGTRVTTRNMDDILGDGVFSFDGFRTLTVRGSYTGSGDVIRNNGIENIVIRAETDSVLTCTREDKNPILLRADTTITGPGKLTLSGGDTGVYLTKMDGTLTIRDAALDITGSWGVGGTNMKNNAVLVIDHSEIAIDSGYGAICDFGGGITLTDCEIAAPADGKISDDGKDIVDGAGTRCTKVQIKATVRANPFEDVAEDTYYYDAVLWAVNHNPQITNGTDATHFSPNATCTRGQVVTFLWRAAGCPEPTGDKNPFTDVKSGAYYYKAVLWAVENGITKGTSATTFSPDQGCTRGQVVTFLHRFEHSPAPGSAANPFTDVKPGAFYYDAVLWAVEKGVTKGTSATAFSPNQTCTRAQIVTFLYRDMT